MELHVLGVRIRALYGLGGHDLDVRLLEFVVQKFHGAVAGVVRHERHRGCLAAQNVPHHALGLVAGDGHADGCAVAFGKSPEGDIVVHRFVLSKSSPCRLDQPQPLRRVLRQRLQGLLLRGQMRIQRVLVVVEREKAVDLRQPEAHVLERGDAPDNGKLVFCVIAVVGKLVDKDGAQEPDLVVMPQHADADS